MSNFKKYIVPAVILGSAAPAFAAEGSGNALDKLFSAVDLSSVVTFVGGAGVTIIGIALAIKGISLAKRLVSKA